ncbi:AbiH family protein [Levilactobacillus brevis]|uniref:AbiH family protein n=1 Tax=Levilactobacillus brevis TaxID=1580 RepID=UPI002073931C|nr:AbiH family protein [Levilactobacillus brevis]
MNNNLIILGNGFDLHNKLNSGFWDFFDARENELKNTTDFTKLFDEDSMLEIQKDKKTRENIRGLIIKRVKPNLLKYSLRMHERYKRFNNISVKKISFWDFYFQIRKLKDPDWFYVENQIQGFFEEKKSYAEKTRFELVLEYLDALLDVGSGNAEESKVDNYTLLSEHLNRYDFETEALVFIIVNVFKYDFQKQHLADFLLSQLVKFEKRLQNYLVEKVSSTPEYHDNVTRCIDELSGGIPYNILNFNYTDIPMSKNGIEQNVHGSLADHPILGIDAMNVPLGVPYYSFTKTFRIMKLANEAAKKVLPKRPEKVIFYGHSLSEADYSYFQSIFDYYSIYDSEVKLVFYYSTYPKHDETMVSVEQYARVVKLLAAYGKTIPNHGNNLLHKLMLERRISFKLLE